MHTVMTQWGHGEKDKLELYEDGEFGTRPGRTRYRPGIDRYGPGDKIEKTIWPVRLHRLSFKSNGMGPLGLAGAMWQRHNTIMYMSTEYTKNTRSCTMT